MTDVTLVPIPTRTANARRRGFDHLALLTRVTCRRSGLPPPRSLLADRRRAGASKSLGAGDREAGTSGAFEVTGPVIDTPVILVDDIVTTGATVREAAAAAVIAGVHVIAAACVAGTP